MLSVEDNDDIICATDLAENEDIKKPRRFWVRRGGELTWLLGVIFVACGVALCKKADLGVSMIAAPAFILFEALSAYVPFLTVGTTEYLFQGVLLMLMCLVIMRFNWRYLWAFAVAVIYGYVLDFWLFVFGTEPFSEIYLRWIFLIVGDVITAFGVACFFRTYMPLQVYELFVAQVAERYSFNVNKTKWVFDISSLILSILLALTLFGDAAEFDWSTIYYRSFHSIGLGTLVTTIINSPIIAFLGRCVASTVGDEPLLPRLVGVVSPSHHGK